LKDILKDRIGYEWSIRNAGIALLGHKHGREKKEQEPKSHYFSNKLIHSYPYFHATRGKYKQKKCIFASTTK
jgi:hypothetical protein